MSSDPPPTVPVAAVRRCLSVLAEVQQEVAELVLPVEGGTAVLSPSLPLVWDANGLRLLPRTRVSASELVGAAARLAVEHRVAAVTVNTDDVAQARLLAPAFAALGWVHEQLVVMLATGGADRPPHRWAPVTEVDAALVAGARREWLEAQAWATPAVVQQILEHDGRHGLHLKERCFAVQRGREVVSCCRLYQRTDVAQIEDVVTTPLERNKGYARAVVAAARAAAEGSGARDVFLVADAQTWSRRFYQRLGFSPGRTIHRFRPETA